MMLWTVASSDARFLSTLPVRGATRAHQPLHKAGKFLSTLPARGATYGAAPCGPDLGISIHAPREGSDSSLRRSGRQSRHFYPRSL